MARTAARRVPTVVAAIAFAVLVLAAPAWADVNFTSGGAYGESVDVTVVGVHVLSTPKPTVTLPPTGGGPFTASLASVDVPDLLHTGLLEVSTQGALGPAGFAKSSADVNNTRVGPAASPILTASVIHSECNSNSQGSSGDSSLVALAIGSSPPVTLSPGPNTVIPLAGVGELRLNEQITNTTGGSTSITVNAIHVVLDGILGTGDIIISQSRCGVAGPNVIIPEVRLAVLLPASAAVLMGAGVWIARRRRRSAE